MAEKKYKIGIVDDHVQTAVSISQVLEHNGFETFQAYNGEEAIAACNKEKPDLVISDIKLNAMTGYDVAKSIPKCKVLFITGYEIDRTKTKQLKNVVGTMRKPIDINKLADKVRKILKVKKVKEV